jgi:hypothetical protein
MLMLRWAGPPEEIATLGDGSRMLEPAVHSGGVEQHNGS